MLHSKWTKKEIKVLRKVMPAYFRGELSRQNIEKLFNRSIDACQHKLIRLGVYASDIQLMDEKELAKIEKLVKL